MLDKVNEFTLWIEEVSCCSLFMKSLMIRHSFAFCTYFFIITFFYIYIINFLKCYINKFLQMFQNDTFTIFSNVRFIMSLI